MNNLIDREKRDKLAKYIKEKRTKGYYSAALMPVLHKVQELYGYIGNDSIDYVSKHLKVPSSQIWGVVTFYHYFSLKPRGKYVIAVCLGTACYIKGSGRILDHLKDILKIECNETSADGLFTIEEARCLGCCGLAPVMMINDKVYEKLSIKKVDRIINEIIQREEAGEKVVVK